jgi:osmotically-inducible protein OsmY
MADRANERERFGRDYDRARGGRGGEDYRDSLYGREGAYTSFHDEEYVRPGRENLRQSGGYYGRGGEETFGSVNQVAYGGRTGRSSEIDRSQSDDARKGYVRGYSPGAGGSGLGEFFTERPRGRERYDERRESHAGRGPKNYRRSDESIADDVNERLTRDPRVDAGDIEVGVKDGVVTLSGKVQDRRMKYLAEDIAGAVSGVADVTNQLRVNSNRQSDPYDSPLL